jgi:hypothetical protein
MSTNKSKLDGNQVLRESFNDATGRLQVETEFVGEGGALNVNCVIDAVSGDNLAISDGTNTAEVTVDGELKVSDPQLQTLDLRRAQTILFAPINISNSGTNMIVGSNPTKKIKVLSYTFVVDGTVTVKWQAAGVDLTGAMPFTLTEEFLHHLVVLQRVGFLKPELIKLYILILGAPLAFRDIFHIFWKDKKLWQ